ncbi:AAA family ATPase [Sulfurovum sp. TSL1]|uniref:AAA family ATPase n=1 Tax=Sulfurovum sp. TSL1 TaxID=2826994 RepID=UPI001CC80A97|nr:AAA family ATPase [Sulfurovum sp. TSL1]
MELLEYYQNQRYATVNYVPRKCQLPLKGDINLYGARGAGKTTMILDLIQEEEEETTLYIDMEDPNLIFNRLTTLALQQYIDRVGIVLLILDHYTEGYLPSFPNVERLIVLSRLPLHHKDLIPVELFPLDYEEFLAFESTTSQSSGFNHFLRSGTLPMMARSQKNHIHVMKNFFKSAFDTNEQKLLLVLAQHHTKHLTTHQIYTFAKEKFKVSKDWLYRTMKLFTEEKLVLFIEDRYQKSGKKMLIFDFAFAKYLTLGQPFILQFETMIALALMKHGIEVETLGIHGYVTKNNELIIPAPFESEESLWVKSQSKFSIYKKYGIKKVTIVTVANTYEYHIEKLYFEAIPFNEWSVINAEE